MTRSAMGDKAYDDKSEDMAEGGGYDTSIGDDLSWTSDIVDQGGHSSSHHNGCVAKGTCGLLHNTYGRGGGWQFCVAYHVM